MSSQRLKPRVDHLYTDIIFELTNFENNEDEETTSAEWAEIFYRLLVRVQNAIDTHAWEIGEYGE